MASVSEDKGMFDGLKDTAKSVISWPDRTKPPDFLKKHISDATWKKTARVGFYVIMVVLGPILIYIISKFMNITNPSIMTLMPLGAGLVLSGYGLKLLIEELVGKHMRTAAKIMAVLLPILLIGGTIGLVGAGLHSLMGGFGFNAYFMAGIVMVSLTPFAIKHSASVFQSNNGTYFQRRAALPPIERSRVIPNSDN